MKKPLARKVTAVAREQIKELKGARDKEMKGVLTPEQKKRLDEILTGKDK